MEKVIDCHSCYGKGKIAGTFPVYAEHVPQDQRKLAIEIPCEDCKGTGKLPEDSKYWRISGEKIRDARISRRLLLCKASEYLKIDSSTLCKMERGVIEPDSSLVLKILKLPAKDNS